MTECLDKPPEFAVGDEGGHGAKCVLADHDYVESEALDDDYFASPLDGMSDTLEGEADD
jgi:peptide/nickel transport system ATP-binding protein